MRSTSKISVIIPVYNAEKTITKCLKSILLTSYKNYEVIVIDDGSTDDSVALIKEFAREYPQIILLTQENAGPSAARNKGLDVAKGNVITFVDSDDYVCENFIGKLAKVFNNSDVDVLFFAFNRVNQYGEIISVHHLPAMQADYFANLIALSQNDMFRYTWVKALRKEVIGTKRFDASVKLYEDEIFTCQVLQEPVTIAYLDEPLYCYVRIAETLATQTNQSFSQINDMIWNAWNELLKAYPNRIQFMEQKANHIVQNCKWYALERNVKAIAFYRSMAKSEYIKHHTLDDPFVCWIKSRHWLLVFLYHNYYKCKVAIANRMRKASKKAPTR